MLTFMCSPGADGAKAESRSPVIESVSIAASSAQGSPPSKARSSLS